MRRKQLFNPCQCIDPKPQKDVFYIHFDGKQAGPMNETEVRKLVNNGTISAETFVWMPSLNHWMQAQYIPRVNKLLLLAKNTKIDITQSIASKSRTTFREDLISALCGLGYKNAIVTSTSDDIIAEHPNISLEEGIKMALSKLSKL